MVCVCVCVRTPRACSLDMLLTILALSLIGAVRFDSDRFQRIYTVHFICENNIAYQQADVIPYRLLLLRKYAELGLSLLHSFTD